MITTQENTGFLFKISIFCFYLSWIPCFGEQSGGYLLPEFVILENDNNQVLRIPQNKVQRQISLDELLQEIPGLSVRKQSGLGAFSSLSFRGGKSEQILFFLDDVLLNNQANTSVDVSKIPIQLISRIEIDAFGLKNPSLFYSGLLSIYLYTAYFEKDDSKESELGASAKIGSFSQYQFSAYLKENFKGLQYNIFGVSELAKNNFPYLNNQNTAFNNEDDAIDYRSNNQYYNVFVQGQLFYNLNSQTRCKTSLNLQGYRRHFPGIDEETSFSIVTKYSIETQIKNHFKNSKIQFFITKLMHSFSQEDFKDPNGKDGVYRFELARELWTLQGDSKVQFKIEPFIFQLGLLLEYEKIKDLNLIPRNSFVAPPNAEMWLGSFGKKIIWNWFKFKTQIKLNYTGYYLKSDSVELITKNVHAFSQNKFSYHFNISEQYQNNWIRVLTQYRFEQKSPSLDEFLGDNHTVLKNLNLQTAKTHLLQLQTKFLTWTQSRLSVFIYRYQNPIELVFLNERYSRYENQFSYISRGFEFSTNWIPSLSRYSMLLAWRLKTTTTYLRSVINDPTSPFFGNVPAFSHRWKHHADLTWFGFPRLKTSLTLNYRSTYFEGQTNFSDQHNEGSLLWSSFVNLKYDNFYVQGSIYNLTNVIYNDFRYQPNSGRSFFLGLTFYV